MIDFEAKLLAKPAVTINILAKAAKKMVNGKL